jgi:phosphoglycolate phosphatase
MIELVVLDMAGTTIEEHGAVYAALHDAVAAQGGDVTDTQVQDWMGTDKRVALRALAELGGAGTLDDAAVERAYGTFRELLADRYRRRRPAPIPGVPEALAKLRADGVRVALTTGFARDVAEPLLVSLGWVVGGDLIDAVVCVDEVAAGRPAPYLIFRAMERTGVLAVDRVLAAGDTIVDLQAATNAGVAAAVGVGTGKLGLDELARHPHTHLLPSAAELPGLVATL